MTERRCIDDFLSIWRLTPDAEPFDWTDQVAATVTSPYDWLRDNAKPAWFKMVAVNAGSNTWRLKGTNENLDAAFQVLMAPPAKAEAAE